jgi:predicted secreted hydrolase
MARSRHLIWVVLAAFLSGCGAADVDPTGAEQRSVTGLRFLGGMNSDGFLRANGPRALEFPRDHGPHPAYRNEWWYVTGNLFSARGRHFGFELTFFRLGLEPAGQNLGMAPEGTSVWMAHFAVTDPASDRFFAAERMARDDARLAFARGESLDVRVEDWHLAGSDSDRAQLHAAADGYAVDLELTGLRGLVLQGDGGYDRKGPEAGNASYYYSVPRIAAHGTIETPDTPLPVAVSGGAWLDREWGTSALSPGVEGWDWFALQLSDGRSLMYYRLRNSAGGSTEFSGGVLVDADGSARRLGPDAIEAEAIGHWRSPGTGVTYPVEWRLRLADEGLDLKVQPLMDEQELRLSVRYWEGAVEISGESAGGSVQGVGYLELAGYR